MRKRGRSLKRLVLLLVLSMVLTGIAPVMQAEAASLYKKFPTYTRYENKFGKSGMTANAGALENLLGAKTYQYVYLRNMETAETYRIPANSKFAEKRLRINAPLSKVVNHASMKIVKITEAANWTEYGKGNSFAVVDENAKFEIGTGAKVEKLYFQADNGTVDLDVKGDVKKTGFYGDKMDAKVTISQGTTKEFRVAAEDSKVDVTVEKTAEVSTVKVVKDADITLNVNDGVEKVVVDAPANITITGDSEKVKEVAIEVGTKAEGAKVASDVPVKAEVGAKADITLKEGAEGSTINKANETVDVALKNDTKENVTVSTEGSSKTENVPSTNPGGSTGGDGTGTDSGSGTGTGTGSGSGNGGTGVVDPGPGYPTPEPTPTPDPTPDEPTVDPSSGSAIKAVAVASSDVNGTVSGKDSKGVYTAIVDLTAKGEITDPVPVKVTLTGVTSGAITVEGITPSVEVTDEGDTGCNFSFTVSTSELTSGEVTKTITVKEGENGAIVTTIKVTVKVAVEEEEEVEATLEIMTAEGIGLYSSLEGFPGADKFGSPVITKDTDNSKSYKVTGSLDYVEGWTGFNKANEEEQKGHYLPLCFAVPSEYQSSITISTGSKDFNSSVLDPLKNTKYFTIMWRVTDKTSLTLTVDWDGAGTMAAQQYTIDLSGLTLNPKADSNGSTVE